MEPGAFAARGPALGYLYQFRLALLVALTLAAQRQGFALRIEALDDVQFDLEGDARLLLQAKHHLTRQADLADSSTDLWRTIRVWIHAFKSDAPFRHRLFLVTTAHAREGSAAWHLRWAARNPDQALAFLTEVAETSQNTANAKAYRDFLALAPEKRLDLLTATVVIDAAPDIGDLEPKLAREVRWAAGSDQLAAFLTRLEGWWFRRIVVNMRNDRDVIVDEELESEIAELREQFQREALPIDDDLLDAYVESSEFSDMLFVKQLELVRIGATRLLIAARNYYRAYEQRSRWIREQLLLVGELERYEARLVEEWQLVFERHLDNLPLGATGEEKVAAGKLLYQWVEDKVIPIRERVTEPFVSRGSYHILSNRLKVGWHPEFLQRLQHLLPVEPRQR